MKLNWVYLRWIVWIWWMILGVVERVFLYLGYVYLYKVFRFEFDEVDVCWDNVKWLIFCCRFFSNMYNFMGFGKCWNMREVEIVGINIK